MPGATGRANDLRPNSSKPNQSQTKPDQENGLGFSWIPSSNSGLFNGLRAIQIKFNSQGGQRASPRHGTVGDEKRLVKTAHLKRQELGRRLGHAARENLGNDRAQTPRFKRSTIRPLPPGLLEARRRASVREGGKVRSRTLANISDWPEAKIDSLRRVLAGETLAPLGAEPFEIARALAHGHVAAVLGTVRRLGLDKALPKGPGAGPS